MHVLAGTACPPPRGCRTLAPWLDDTVVPSGLLKGALAFAYDHSDGYFRVHLAQVVAARRTRILAEPINDPSVLGFFRASDNTIVIDATLVTTESTPVVAAIIAHEWVHAALNSHYPDSRHGVAQCYQEEILAYRWEAAFWQSVRGLAGPSNGARNLDALAVLANAGAIPSSVLGTRSMPMSVSGPRSAKEHIYVTPFRAHQQYRWRGLCAST